MHGRMFKISVDDMRPQLNGFLPANDKTIEDIVAYAHSELDKALHANYNESYNLAHVYRARAEACLFALDLIVKNM